MTPVLRTEKQQLGIIEGQCFLLAVPRWCSGKESTCQCGSRMFEPWVRKIPRRRKWKPAPGFLPGNIHRPRSLAGYSPRGSRESDVCDREHTHICSHAHTHTHACTHTHTTRTHTRAHAHTQLRAMFPLIYATPCHLVFPGNPQSKREKLRLSQGVCSSDRWTHN